MAVDVDPFQKSAWPVNLVAMAILLGMVWLPVVIARYRC
jgi:hypothetical protein